MPPTVLGRDAELATIRRAVDAARSGVGSVVRVLGEPGLGKSALLDAAATELADDVRVLRLTGHETEVDLPWSGIEELLAPLVADGFDAELVPRRRAALRAVIALDADPVEIDPLAAIAAVRDVVLAAASVSPVVIMVDDAPWIDEPTARALRHATGRWRSAPVVLIEARRLDALTPTTSDDLVLEPIGREHALQLVADAGVRSPALRERLVDELGGRPLLLRAAVHMLDDEADHAVDGPEPDRPLRFPPSAVALARRRLDALGEVDRWALLVAAATQRGALDLVSSVLAADGRTLADLDAAERAGIIRLEGTVVFTHPTLRSAAYHGASGSDRRRAHRLIGERLDDPSGRVRHLGLSVAGPDGALAAEVDEAARRLVQRGGPVEAARALQLAARLSDTPLDGAVRLRRAAELLVDTVEASAAILLLDRADLVPAPSIERVRRDALRLRVRARSGSWDDVPDELVRLADAVEAEDPSLAVELLLDALPPLLRSFRFADMRRVAERAHDLAAGPGDDRDGLLRLRAAVALGTAMTAMGDPAGRELLDLHTELLAREGAASAGAFLAEVPAPVLGFLHRGAEATALLDVLAADLREREALPVLVAVLSAQAMLRHGPDLPGAVAAAAEACEIAERIGQPDLARFAGGSLVVAAAMIGDADVVEDAAARLERGPDPFGHRSAAIGRGALALGVGDLDRAITTYEALEREHGIGVGVTRWEAEWVEALVRAQRREEAAALLRRLDEAGLAPWAHAGLERVRGMLAVDDVVAAEHFERSLTALRYSANDVGLGRTHLAWGERLRRARRRAAAREHLEPAHAAFERSGARIWQQRAAAELDLAAGVTPGAGRAAEDLTAQERRIARLAADGATNRDIGNELFVSHRTVEAHLSAIYRKLGIRNRRDLLGRDV